jgi:hypothetical protein
MGAVLGIAAFGRTQEKLNGANNGGLAPVSQSVTTTFSAPSTGGFSAPSSFSSPAPSTSFTAAPSWGTTPVSTAPAVVAGFGGKPAPVQPEQPQI